MSSVRQLLLSLLVVAMAGEICAYFPSSIPLITPIAAPQSAFACRRQMGVLRAAAEGGGGVKDEDEPKITIVGALVERHGKYLMVERLKRSRGYFEFPGGKVEEGETDASALVRELREELQVEGNIIGLEPVAVGQDGPVQLKCYRAEFSGEPQVPRDTLSFRWVGLEELKSLAVPPADQAVVRSLFGA